MPGKRVTMGCTLAIVLTAFTLGNEPWPRFVQPKGWPKPHYDFTKHPQTEAGFALGRKLFYDPILSLDTSTSCASCHTPQTGFAHVDHAVSHGIKGRIGTRNAPSLVNLAWNTSFHLDGGVHHLEVQPLSPISHPAEMGHSIQGIVARLRVSPIYKKHFMAAFGDSTPTGQRVLLALAQFTVSLQSYNSRYDQYLRQEPGTSFNEQEIKGLTLFRQHCAKCHSEPLFTDYSFANIGLEPDSVYRDVGRFAITKYPKDSFAFRVPTLRNVAYTFPYMHDGRFTTLKQVMDYYSQGIATDVGTLDRRLPARMPLTPEEKKDIIAFLLTLSDKEFLFDKRLGYVAD